MKKTLIFLIFTFIMIFFGQTYSYEIQENNDITMFLIQLKSINSQNILKSLDNCYTKIVSLYPEEYMYKYNFNYESDINNITNFEKYYQNKISKISKTEYYKTKATGIKIKKIKIYARPNDLRKCAIYLEKITPL